MAVTAEQRAYRQAYYQANKEAIKARVRAYNAAHPEECAARAKAYQAKHQDRLSTLAKARYRADAAAKIAKQKVWNDARHDEVTQYKREWWHKNKATFAAERRANSAHIKLVQKQWYDRTYFSKHREKYCARNAKRRALKRLTQVEKVDYAQILRDANGLCGICGKPLDLFGTDFDHIVPLARGGAHIRSNIQATHASCNRSKGARVA